MCHILGVKYRQRLAKTRHTDCQHFLLNESNHGTIVAVPPNSGIVLTLKDNPSTGYQWQIIDPRPMNLTMMNNGQHLPVERADTNGEMLIGGDGQMLWRFWANEVGVETLRLRYRRMWESVDEPATEFNVTIAVVEHANAPVIPSCSLKIC